MTSLVFQFALSNACIALVLAIAALILETTTKRSQLAHLLWLLVFVKLVTPPVVTLPVVPFPGQLEGATGTVFMEFPSEGIIDSNAPMVEITPVSSPWNNIAAASNRAKPWLAVIWLLGSGVIFFWSLTRVFRFNYLLKMESNIAPQALQTSARRIAHRLGLKAAPTIHTTSAHLSPMVWWIGGKVRVVIPLSLIHQMDTKESEWILAHELAHVRRRDYLVRWIEWLACVCFWWNPLVWWARHRLRFNEEICCDDLVLASFNPSPHTYATALLNAIEFLARPGIRPPVMASEMNSGGFLERRFKMITSKTTNRAASRWPQVCVILLAVAILPIGLAVAGEQDSAKKEAACKKKPACEKKESDSKKKSTDEYYKKEWKRLQTAVETGKMTQKEAHAKMAAIKKRKGDSKTITREDYAKAESKLRKAVAEGKISGEDARKKLAGMRKQMEQQHKRGEGNEQAEREHAPRKITREDYARTEAQLKKAVANGRISEKDAKALLNGMRKAMAKQSKQGEHQRAPRKITQKDYNQTEAKLFRAVENGRISGDDARKRLAEMRKVMAAQGK